MLLLGITLALFFAILIGTLHEAYSVNTVSLIIYGALFWWLKDFNYTDFLVNNWTWILLGIVIYFLVGFIWSLHKWRLLCKREFKKYNNRKPLIAHYDDKIIGWMSYWPMSMLVYVLGDLVRDAFHTILERTYGLYEKIADHYFQDKDTRE